MGEKRLHTTAAPGSGDNWLLVDNSNSWTKWCALRSGRLGRMHRYATPQLSREFLSRLHAEHGGCRILCASVVPDCRRRMQSVWGKTVHWVGPDLCAGLRIRYPKPSSVGADRIANAVAVAHLYKSPAVVIDLGTAITFDVIDADGAYIGGVITPGLNVFMDYLNERTALLPRVELKLPRSAVGKSTQEAMRIGAVVGTCGLIREILREIEKEQKVRLRSIIATGGDSRLLRSRLPEITLVDPLLTMRGLKLIAECCL